MKKVCGLLVCVLALAGYARDRVSGGAGTSLRGFFPRDGARELDVEAIFRSIPTAEQARQDLWTLTRAPHVASTPEDYETAQYVLKQFRDAGLDAAISEYQVLLPMPKEEKVDLVEPFKREGPTPEGGGLSGHASEDSRVIPPFNAYSPSGEVEAQVIYANYGTPDDYRRLRDMGVDVAGKIVIARYGKCFRGVKAYVAQENHAAGLLLYSDPADDGYRQGDVFPRGPWRPATGVQRGSILFLTAYSGDPLTPGVAATKDARRLSMKDAPTLPRIPTTPLSYGDASPILENLSGPVAPHEWQGSLPFTYHVGPGKSKVHLKLEMDFQIRTIWNVTARVQGTTQPDEWVILGNHRDAWTYGAADPDSGTAPLLAVARGLGELLKRGWKPRRTIVLGSWDAEEFGLIGSTEWVEEHAEELSRQAVAYLNMDVGVCGPYFGASAVPSLRALIREVAEDVDDPRSGRTLYAVWSEQTNKLRRESGPPVVIPTQGPIAPESGEARVGELGSGSDYTPFLQHLGVPSLDLGFGGSYGVYHALFDNFYWMEAFGDPDFKYSVAAAQTFGLLALRLADSDLLPFDYAEYGTAILKYLRDLEDEMRKNRQDGRLQFQDVETSAQRFTEIAQILNQRMVAATRDEQFRGDAERLERFNHLVTEVERDFLLSNGLPRRAWFRHAFYAPGVYTGYAAVILPGVREALARQEWVAAAEQLKLVQGAIERGTVTLSEALQAMEGGAPPPAIAAGHGASN